MSTPPLCIVIWKHGYPSVALCVCPVILLLFQHLGKKVYMHQHMYLCPPDSPCQLQPCCIVIWKHGYPSVALCVCPVILLLFQHLGKKVYMHQHMYLCPSDSPCQLQPCCIVIWKHGCPSVALCVCPPFLFTLLV